MQYRNGQFLSAGTAVTLPLGFVPDRIKIYNWTNLQEQSEVIISEWINNVIPTAHALIWTATAGAPVESELTSNGVTPVVLGGDWQNTIYTITNISNASPGVVTVSSVTPTNSMTLVNGMTVTISGVKGMTGLNSNRFIVAGISGTSFNLYDLFGNPFSTVGLGTYSSGGQLDMISYPPTAPVLNATTGQVITPGSPAGLQYDIGYEGVILGTGVVGDSGDTIWWEAFYATPTGW